MSLRRSVNKKFKSSKMQIIEEQVNEDKSDDSIEEMESTQEELDVLEETTIDGNITSNITPFRIVDAQSNRSNPFISAPEGGILNENWCNKRCLETREEQDKELDKSKDIGDYIVEKFYIYLNSTFSYLYYVIKITFKVSGIYFMWIILHYGASHLYIQLCVPKTPWGFLISPFLTATPHCQGLRWIVYNAANVINNMWVILGAWICSTILLISRENGEQNT
jgi:hypothetical protein